MVLHPLLVEALASPRRVATPDDPGAMGRGRHRDKPVNLGGTPVDGSRANV
jgi:hypothetical protein